MNAAYTSQPDDWPLSRYSEMVVSGGIKWHVQRLGEGPLILLLHGTGASTHSWRELAGNLRTDYQIVMCDLPGHGFTGRPENARMSLPGMSGLIAGLLDTLSIVPDYLVGHSAGAALCCQLSLNATVRPRCIASINGALQPFNGVAGQVFLPLAQLLSLNPLIPRLVSWRAKNSTFAARLLNDTGSSIDAEGRDYYIQLLRNPEHVTGALRMMAHWNLDTFSRRLPQLNTPLHLIVGTNDRTVPASQAGDIRRRVRTATLTRLPSLGHLAHEEAPKVVADVLRQLFVSRSDQSDFPSIVQPDDQQGL